MENKSEKRDIQFTAENVPKDATVNIFTAYTKHLKGKPAYLRFFTEMAFKMAADKDFTLTDLRVFLGLLNYTDFENVIDISQQALAGDLSIDRPDLSRSIKKLISKGYIQLFATKGKQNVYRLNPYVAFKSKGKNLEALQAEFEPIE
jgi:predicted transcriptional regulator